MKAIEAYLTTLYSAALSGKPCETLPDEFNGEELFKLARAHGIAEAVYYPLKDTAYASYFEEAHNSALKKEALRVSEEARIFAAFDSADISYLPLMDSVLRQYYPKPDMRGEGATDLMVDSYARKATVETLKAAGYRSAKGGLYVNEAGKTFELHSKPDDASAFHKQLMEHAVPVSEQANRHSLSYSDFYIYAVSNFARLLKAGKAKLCHLGDIKVFYSRCGSKLDEAYVTKNLADMGLIDFETELKKLILVLFYNGKGSSTTTGFANCIFSLSAKPTKEQKKDKKELFVALGIAYSKNGKQRMSGSDIALSAIVILVLIFSIVFISTAFFEKEHVRFTPPEYSGDGENSEADENVGDGEGSGEGFELPEQYYATIPYRGGVYKGYVTHNVPNGSGELTLPNNERYIGSFASGLFNGKGVYYYLDGRIFDGMWFEGEINGEGTLTFADESYIFGNFVDGTPQGVCVYQNSNGDVYEGELKDGKRTGKGRFSWANGDVYEGDYIDGRREGYGKYVDCNGDTYEGEWIDSVPNGNGTMSNSEETVTGVFIEGVIEGEGKATMKNGDVYEGYYVHGIRTDDHGVMTFRDGSKYEGAFADNVFNGEGKFTFKDGDTVTGTFENGLLQGRAKYYDKGTGVTRTITYKDGKPV